MDIHPLTPEQFRQWVDAINAWSVTLSAEARALAEQAERLLDAMDPERRK